MGFRFRKRIKLFPGLHLNISKRGYSISVGERGLTTNISRKGLRETVSAPGTGISYQTKTAKWAKVPRSGQPIQKRARAKSVNPGSVLAFVLVLAAILWILAHWH
jgi:Protein of unknown function (DUF4236)